MRRRGRPVLSDDLAGAQAGAMLLARLTGATIRELEQRFSCSRATVYRRLALVRDEGVEHPAFRPTVEGLLGKAIVVLDEALEAGSLDAARAVLVGTGLLELPPGGWWWRRRRLGRPAQAP